MIKEIKKFERKELFEHYHSFTNPFAICTTKIDITNIVNYCKKHRNFYSTLGFIITKTVNQIEAFKYRYKDGKIYYCEEIQSNYTQMYENKTIGYFSVPPINEYKQYIEKFLEIQNKFLQENKYSEDGQLNDIWLSCNPWCSFTSLIPTFSKEITIPQFIWDKYEKVNERYYTNLTIVVHHGFADGYHIGQFVNLLEENIKEFN